MAWWTVVIFSASSSGISISNSSSRAITSSTVSSESAPRSSTNDASFVTCSCLTPSCSATMALTCCSTVLISDWSLCRLFRGCPPFASVRPVAGQVLWGNTAGPATRLPPVRVIVFAGETAGLVPRAGRRARSPVACVQRPHLRHVHAAVDVQGLPGDVSRLRRDEEQDCAGHICSAPEPAHGNLRDERGALRLAERACHVSIDEAGGHRIHRNAARGELPGE